MAGTVRRGLQIAWAALRLGVTFLRLRRRAPELLPAYVSTTLVGLGTTFVKLGQGLSLRWDLLPAPYREALSRLHSDVPAFPADLARRMSNRRSMHLSTSSSPALMISRWPRAQSRRSIPRACTMVAM